MKLTRTAIISTALVLSGGGHAADAGQHSQATHTTPKGYHHDGTYHWGGGELALLLIVGLVFLAIIVAQQGLTGDPAFPSLYYSLAELAEARRRARAERARRAAEREARRLAERADRRKARDAAYRARGVEPGPWAWFKLLPEPAQAILLGLAFATPAAVVAVALFTWRSPARPASPGRPGEAIASPVVEQVPPPIRF